MRLRIRLAAVLFAVMSTIAVQCAAAAAGAGGHDADIAKVRRLLESRRFAELTALLEGYQASCDRDIRYEYAAQNGFLALSAVTASRRALLDEWVRSDPDSWVPLTARATYYHASAWKSRGTAWAKDTSDEQFKGMSDDFGRANRDLEASLRMRPRQLYAYVILMEICQNFGDTEKGALLVRKALELYPDSYILRRRHMLALTPRWGGSYEAMGRFARDSAAYAETNPLIGTLPGFVAWDQADYARRERDYRTAIALYKTALSYGENWNFLYDLARCYYRAEMYGEARRSVDRAIALSPVWGDAYGLRAKISLAQRDPDGARKSLEMMKRPEYLVFDEVPKLKVR